jgi:hypothetical protein
MIASNSCVILIPLYKSVSSLSEGEKLSIRRTNTIFSAHDIIFIAPDSINVTEYEVEFSNDLNFFLIPDIHFDDINSYSKLLMSSFFYVYFKQYDWMLICQPDVYVFKNDLHQFTNQNEYFFIGAPVIDSQIKGWENQTWVGNGGFSLRRIKTCIDVTKRLEKIKKISSFLGVNNLMDKNILFLFFRVVIETFSRINYNSFVTKYLHEGPVNEDVFWCLWVPLIFKKNRPADIATATKFSFETNPESLFQRIGNLPMGCHAWEKYNPEFWRNYIK